MVKQKITFSPKIWDSFVKSQILGIKKIGGQNIETRYSIYEAFGMGGLAWGATWDPFFRKMFGIWKMWVPKFPKNHEIWFKNGLGNFISKKIHLDLLVKV